MAVRNAASSIAVLAFAALAACGGDTDVTNVVTLTPTSLSITTGNNQAGTVGTALAAPLSVKVVDQNANAISGATVSWAVGTGGGTLASATSTTDANGIATMTWTLPNTPGSYSVTASIANAQAAVTFNATATAATQTATSLTLVSGNNQSVAHGTATQAFVIKAVDAKGNPVSGVPITWATTGGGTLSATSGTTDASGLAQVTLTTSSTAGAFTVTASSGTLTPVVFNGAGT